jgi:hypothetical protein
MAPEQTSRMQVLALHCRAGWARRGGRRRKRRLRKDERSEGASNKTDGRTEDEASEQIRKWGLTFGRSIRQLVVGGVTGVGSTRDGGAVLVLDE